MSDDEKRSDQYRVEFGKAFDANLVAIDGTWRFPCMVEDISASGAKLAIEGKCPVDKGKEFFLLMSTHGLVYRRCELAWINGSEIGVNFLTAANRRAARRAA